MNAWITKNNYKVRQLLFNRSNTFLISHADINILVDTGKSSSCKKLIKQLNIFLEKEKKLNYLVLTHTHYDHCQNAAKLNEIYSCKIISSENEKQYTSIGYTPLPRGTNLLSKFLVKFGLIICKNKFTYKAFFANELLPSNGEINIENTNIKIIPTPGHSAGSISVLVDNEIAIVGDTLFGIYKNSIYPPFADDPKVMIKSWKILLQSGCNFFLPGHGNVINRERLQIEYLTKLNNVND